MTKFAPVKTGMARKRERHFPTRYRVIGKALVVVGLVLILVLTWVWSQVLYPSMLDARCAHDAILNEHDEYVNDWTFADFEHREQEEGTDLFLVRLFHVTNPQAFSTAGSKPRLEEKGAYAYVKRSFKYDVEWPHNGELMRFKSWHYYNEVEDVDTCRLMFFRQGLSDYNENDPDHPEGCSKSDDLVTVFNPKFMLEMRDYGTHGLIGTLSQEIFERSERALTQGFVRSVKTELMPEAFEAIWSYRRAVHASTVVEAISARLSWNMSTTNASVLFAGTDDDSTLASFVKTHLDPGTMGVFGAAPAVSRSGASALTTSEADALLRPTSPFGIINFSRGVPLWVGAGRYLRYIDPSPIGDGGAEANARAFIILQNETSDAFGRSRHDAGLLVSAIASYLYEQWLFAPAVDVATALEWGGHDNARRSGGCDAGNYDIPKATTTRFRVADDYYMYHCHWGLSNASRSYYAYDTSSSGRAEPLNATVARLVADRKKRDPTNALGVHHDENLIRLWQAYEYCNATKVGAPTTCAGMSQATSVALHELPLLLARAEGLTSTELYANSNATARVRTQVCAIAAHVFEEFAVNDTWHELFVADWMTKHTDLGSYEFSAHALDDLGYAQWAGGYVTTALWDVPSVSNIKRQGYWKFDDAAYTQDLLEFHSHAMAIGYTRMNLTVAEGRLLLRVLASASDTAALFRANIARLATTYYCDGSDCTTADDAATTCDISFVVRDNRAEDGITDDADDISDLAGTCEPFGSFCDCAAGGDYFYTQNVFANFSATVPARSASTNGNADFADAAALLDKVFMSSSDQCVSLEELYQACVFLETEPNHKVWVTNCDTWQTTISDGAFGIYCDETSILKVNTPYSHDYLSTTSHPYRRKRGNVVASWLKEWTWRKILTQGRIFCDNPESCNYASGAMFVTHTVRRILFEGYVDRLSVKLLNHQLAPHNLTVRCINRSALDYTELCYPVENVECSELGFEIVSATAPGVAQFSRNGSRAFEWYMPEIAINLENLSIPLGAVHEEGAISAERALIVKNPAFAIYPGKLLSPKIDSDALRESRQAEPAAVQDDAVVRFHKANDCVHRLLGGPRLWRSCDITLDTGKRELVDVRRIVDWRGNTTLSSVPEYAADLPLSAGILLGDDFQLEPLGWEGFKWYNYSYKFFRFAGLDFRGNGSTIIVDPDILLVHELVRQSEDDLDIGMADVANDFYVEWPTRRVAGASNYSRRAWIRGNRYETSRATFDAARFRASDRLSDTRGMSYTVPVGMASLQILSGTPLFLSLPHFFGNAMWNGEEFSEVTFDTDEDRRLHSYYIDVEPITGQAIRDARRYQYSYRVERDALYPDIISSQRRCEVPTADFNRNGFGCFIFFPVWWVSEERVIDERHAIRVKRDYLDTPLQVFQTAFYGLAAAASILMAGLIPWLITNRREAAFRTRIYVD